MSTDRLGEHRLSVLTSSDASDIKVSKMSLVDKYEDKSQAAYVQRFDRESARRQFRVSLLLIIAMAVSAFVLGFAMPVGGQPVTPNGSPEDQLGFSGRAVTFDR